MKHNIDLTLINWKINFSEFAMSIPRPFTVHYNPYTQRIEILDSKAQVDALARDIQGSIYIYLDLFTLMNFSLGEMQILMDAMKKIL